VIKINLYYRKKYNHKKIPLSGGIDFSPGGNFIVFSALISDHHQLFRISRDGTKKEQIIHSFKEVHLSQVSPNDHFIACTIYSHVREIWSATVSDE
jgi:Tol biopolymer transport system component